MSGGIDKAGDLTVTTIDQTPDFKRCQHKKNSRNHGQAVIPRLKQEPRQCKQAYPKQQQPAGQSQCESFKGHAFPFGGKGMPVSAPIPLRLVKY